MRGEWWEGEAERRQPADALWVCGSRRHRTPAGNPCSRRSWSRVLALSRGTHVDVGDPHNQHPVLAVGVACRSAEESCSLGVGNTEQLRRPTRNCHQVLLLDDRHQGGSETIITGGSPTPHQRPCRPNCGHTEAQPGAHHQATVTVTALQQGRRGQRHGMLISVRKLVTRTFRSAAARRCQEPSSFQG